MISNEEIEDIDRVSKLLVDYSTRIKELYQRLKTEKFKNVFFSFSALIFMVVIGLVLILLIQFYVEAMHRDMGEYATRGLSFYNSQSIYMTIILLLLTIGIVFGTWYAYKGKKSIENCREDLLISREQLINLIRMISQYTEHVELSELRKFEINLKLTEAEQLIALTEKEVQHLSIEFLKPYRFSKINPIPTRPPR